MRVVFDPHFGQVCLVVSEDTTNFKIFPSFSQMIWSFSCIPKAFLINWNSSISLKSFVFCGQTNYIGFLNFMLFFYPKYWNSRVSFLFTPKFIIEPHKKRRIVFNAIRLNFYVFIFSFVTKITLTEVQILSVLKKRQKISTVFDKWISVFEYEKSPIKSDFLWAISFLSP